jgi:DNA-binding IclR family transcriptional regulator
MATPPRSPILEVLAEDGPATGPELAARLEMHPETVERYCRELQRRNRIRQGTGGLYTLVERERERVRERRASD